jgi:hypothetical protein
MKIELVSPANSYREILLCGLGEFRRERPPRWVGGDLATAEEDLAAFVARLAADANRSALARRCYTTRICTS